MVPVDNTIRVASTAKGFAMGNTTVSTSEPGHLGQTGTAGHKRTADRHQEERAAKRRSSRACLSCRSRKVRCDVVNCGPPCTNCRLDDVECVLRESSRGRKPKKHMAATSASTPAVSNPVSHGAPAIAPRPAVPISYPRASQSPTPRVADGDDAFLVSLTFEDQLCDTISGDEIDDSQDGESHEDAEDGAAIHVHGPSHTSFDSTCNTSVTTNLASPQGSQRSQLSYADNGTTQIHESRDQPPNDPLSYALFSTGSNMPLLEPTAPRQLPAYIKRLPSHITPRDLEYLADKDALTIPDDELRDELLRTYVKIVYCFVPALEFTEFLDPIINGGDIRHPVSLLLFQAVMFASVVFVDSSLLESRGFTSRKAARKVFFNRVRLLYGLDCEPDRMALIQSLLLMTYWYDSPDDEKDTWYWMGITLSLAQVMGLHRDPESLDITVSEKRLRRRVWWSCYIRDRLLALGIRRPARIRSDQFNVPMLQLADYDLAQPIQERIVFVRESGFTSVQDDGRRQMCQMCIDLAKLCVCIGNILHTQYTVVGTNAESHKNLAVLPKQSKTQMADLAKCDGELEDWRQKQAASSRYSRRDSSFSLSGQRIDDWAEDITWLHQALLHMIYLTTVGALHRPRAVMSAPPWMTPSEANAARKDSLVRVKEAAVSMTSLAFDLQSENHLRYLWTSSIPAFLSASLIHLLDINDTDEQVRNMGLGRFYQCFHALCELQDMYTSAEYALRFLEKVLCKASANVPLFHILKFFSSPSASAKGQVGKGNMNHNRRSSSLDARNTATQGDYKPYAFWTSNYSPFVSAPHTSDYLHQLPISTLSQPISQLPQEDDTHSHPDNGHEVQAYHHCVSDMAGPFSPSVSVLDPVVIGGSNLLMGAPAQGMPRFSAATTDSHLAFGAFSDLSGGTKTLVDTPPSQLDIWSEFDGLLFTLPSLDKSGKGGLVEDFNGTPELGANATTGVM